MYSIMTNARNRGLSLDNVITKLNNFAPKSLAEPWDNVGLLVEPVTKKNIERILLTNDLTEDVMEEAVKVHADLIISYHPPIFVPLKSVTGRTWKERIIATCLENRIAVYSPHTSFDAVSGGVNDWLASAFETKSVKPLIQSDVSGSRSKLYQVEMTDPVIEPAESGSVLYQIKKYMEESTRGTREKLIGDICVSHGELKLTVWCSKFSMSLLAEIFHSNVHKTGKERFRVLKYEYVPPHGVGMGRLCCLKRPLQLAAVKELVKKHLNLQHIRVALARQKHMESLVSTIAICAGSGSSVLKGVKADLYLTGEMQHHDILDAVHKDTHVILCDHSNTERGFLKVFAKKLATELCGGSVDVMLSETDRDPLQIM
jgi:dinuclear metal center YbgI/SA1388 family protein